MKEQIVRVEWVDSCSDSGWNKRSFYEKDTTVSKCESVGFLLKKTRTEITIFLSKSHTTGQITELMTIPRKAVTKLYYLKADK